MRAGGFIGLMTLAFIGVIIADVLIHPQGVKAFGSAANSTLKTTTAAMLGHTSK